MTTPIIVTNTDEYLDVLEMKKENVEFGDELITIVKSLGSCKSKINKKNE